MALLGLTACAAKAPGFGSSARMLLVRVNTLGPVSDPDGYTLRIDGVAVLEGQWDGSPRRVGLLEGARVVELGDLDKNCMVEDGPAARPVPPGPARELEVTWRVRCDRVAEPIGPD